MTANGAAEQQPGPGTRNYTQETHTNTQHVHRHARTTHHTDTHSTHHAQHYKAHTHVHECAPLSTHTTHCAAQARANPVHPHMHCLHTLTPTAPAPGGNSHPPRTTPPISPGQ